MKKVISSIIATLISATCIVFYFRKPFDIKYNEIYLLVAAIFLLVATVLITTKFYDKQSKKVKRLENRLDQWNSISYHVRNSGDKAFNELPVGILVYDDDYIVRWANKNAKTIFKMAIIDQAINSLSEEILMHIRAKDEEFVYKFEDKYFQVINNYENNLVYFFDQTDRENLKIKYDERKTAFVIVSIDNLDEAMKRLDMQIQSNIRGEILGLIADYASDHKGYLQNYNDRLLIVCDKEHLLQMVSDKFGLLDSIREIVQREHLRTSVSIGAACYDLGYDELGIMAQQTVELAEKRGGDQVVVNIENEKIQYFGGKINALEKNTLVNARVHALAIKEAIEASSNVIVMAHKMADADAIASTLLTISLVKSTGKQVDGLYDEASVDSTAKKLILNYLVYADPDIVSNLKPLSKIDIKPQTLLIVVDTQSPTIAMYPEIIEQIKNLVVIDHHRHGEIDFVNPIVNYVEPYASSAVELISELFMFFGDNLKISPALATMALAGIVVDTNNFTYRTGSRTFEAASVLKEYDGDMSLVRTLLRGSYDDEIFFANALSHAEIIYDKFAIVKIPEDEILNERPMLAKISDRLLQIDKVEASFTIGCVEKPGLVGVSARSLDQLNVQIIMEEMGGGGHLNAAAFQKEGTTVEAVYNKLMEILKREYDTTGGMDMQVILTEDVKGRGVKGQIINVANGYGNYLLSNKLAVVATPENLKALDEMKAKEEQAQIEHKELMEKLKAEIESKTINLYIKLGSDGKSFGHITTKQVCDEFEAQTGIKLDKKKVELPIEITTIGNYTATVKLHKDVVANIEIKVLEQ